eukprot:XP_011419693.1 PREDICTED: protein FAM122A isoform X1 [Crassostrea gigas]
MASLQREHSMEVDPPSGPASHQVATSSGGNLKRSNSAPMINVLVSQPEISPPTNTFKMSDCSRLRRFSSSSMSLNQPGQSTPVKIPDRVNRLKDEEIHIVEKEKEHERDVSSAIKMSNSWQDFTLDDHQEVVCPDPHRRPRSFSESLHINVFPQPPMLVGAPSPTRVGNRKQCFSPSMQMPVKSNSFTPSPSPSPTRKSFMRSLSPIAVRPSPVGKRKLDTDMESYLSPPKRFQTGPSTPDRIMAHPLAHSSISSSSLEDGSPEQLVPRSGANAEISHPRPHHMYGFMPLKDNSNDMQTTDSETSDITDHSADISDQSSISISASPGSSFQPIRQTHL